MVYSDESEEEMMLEEERADVIIREILDHWDDEEWEAPE